MNILSNVDTIKRLGVGCVRAYCVVFVFVLSTHQTGGRERF
jgi:hypothetical protein